jgi:hypothetical protein
VLLDDRAPDTSVGAVATAARRAGARELVDAALYNRGDGRLRLDLSRVDLASGVLRGALTVEGDDLATLLDSAAFRLADELGRPERDRRVPALRGGLGLSGAVP